VLQDASLELKNILELFLESLTNLKESQPEIYQEAVDEIVGKIRNL